MAIGRETIYTALFNQLSLSLSAANGGAFNTVSRRMTAASQLTESDCPAIFLHELGERYEQSMLGGPAKVTLMAQAYMYAMCDLESDVPAATINNLCDNVEDAIAPIPALGVQTLGDLVQHCWLEGRMSDYIATQAGRLSITVLELAMLVDH